MKRTLTLVLTIALTLTLAFSASATKLTAAEAAKALADELTADQKVLNILTWTYYIPDEVVLEFEEATGIRVNYTSMMGNEDVLPKLSTGGAQYDIVVCSDYINSELIELGLLLPIDAAKLSNYGNIAPVYQGQYFDPENAYTIPYATGTPLIVYDPTAVDFEVTGYADLWREEFAGKLALVSEWRNVIGLAQKKLGYSYNDTDPAHIAQVGEELKALKPNIAVLNDDTPHFALISGDAIAGFMYGSQIIAARDMMPQLKVVYPAEGLGFGIDCLSVPKDAPHSEAAYIFLDYILDGEVSAYASELINYGNCNQAASEFMSEAYLSNADVILVPADLLKDAEMIRTLDNETQTMYDEIWTSFMQ